MPALKVAQAHDNRPTWLFGLRLAAKISNYLLLVFALYLLFAGTVTPPTVAYLLLIVAFCWVNLWVINRLRQKPFRHQERLLRHAANWLNAALPLAFVVARWWVDPEAGVNFHQALAICVPALLNWLAVECSVQYAAAPRPGSPGERQARCVESNR